MARTDDLIEAVVPNDYAGLRGLAWNRDPARPIPAAGGLRRLPDAASAKAVAAYGADI